MKEKVKVTVFLIALLLMKTTFNILPEAFASGSMQQDTRVSGQVSDAKDIPLPGVTVSIKGTTIGTITDNSGRYSLLVGAEAENPILVFSFVGMKTLEIPLDGRALINVKMETETIGLEEVVAVGYSSQQRVNITGAVGSVQSDQLANRPVLSNVYALSGKLPGMQIVDVGGVPGATNSVYNIRGYGSPLVFIDGVEQSFDFINPDEIESVSILKDASASIYGARAGNGVILVTTKRGKISKPTFNFTSSYTLSTPTMYPEFADAALYCEIVNEADITDGAAPRFTEEEIEKYRDGTDPLYPNTDWWNETMRKYSPMSVYSLNARGGSESVKYFFSLGYKDQGSMLQSEDLRFRNYNLRSNLDMQFTKNLSGSFDMSAQYGLQESPGQTFSSTIVALNSAKPIVPVRWPDPSYPSAAGEKDGSNPVYTTQKEWSGYQNRKTENFRTAISLNYDLSDLLIDGLETSVRADFQRNNLDRKEWLTGFDFYDYNPEDDTYIPLENFNHGKITLTESTNKASDWKLEYKLSYSKIFNKVHRVSGLLVYEALSDRWDYFEAYREGYVSNSIDFLFAGSQVNKDNTGYAGEGGRHSYIGRFNYGFRDKYLAEFIFRYDASAKFNEENRWGFFPALSLGWRISEESFIKERFSNIDNLKLRLSYGEAGDEGNISFNYLTGYEFARQYIFSYDDAFITNGLVSTGLANPDATWATTKIFNIGLDGSISRSILYWELDLFYRIKDDILATRAMSIPSTFGAVLPEENINSLTDRGFELLIGHRNSIGKVNYHISGNISWARSKWKHFDEPEYTDPDEIYRYKKSGKWRNVTYGYLTDGLFSDQEEIDGWADITQGNNNNVIMPGDIRFLDMNNDSIINWRDERAIGRSKVPEIYAAINASVSYKGVELSALVQGATNYSVFYDGKLIAPLGTQALRPYAFFGEAWTTENPDPEAALPRLRHGPPSTHFNTSYTSDFFMTKNAYYVRFKELRLSYSFAKNLLGKVHLDNTSLSVYAMLHNFGVITNVKYLDPETQSENGQYYPQQKSLMFGVNLKF